MRKNVNKCGGFSLIELVIVVVIIGIIAAIAIPRLSRGSAGAADSALSGNLQVLRSAIDLYATEHGGTYPSVGSFDSQLTLYTDSTGSFSASKTSTAIYGPYLRKTPTLPVGNNKGSTGINDASSASVGAGTGGWYYNPNTGDIHANTDASSKDSAGVLYSTY